MNQFVIPGLLSFPGSRRRPLPVSLFLEADDRSDALFQVHHGVIEANVAQSFPGAKVTYDARRMKMQFSIPRVPR